MKFFSFEALWFGLLGKHLNTTTYRYNGKPKDVYHDETTGFLFDPDHIHPIIFSDKIKKLIPVGTIINIGSYPYFYNGYCAQ